MNRAKFSRAIRMWAILVLVFSAFFIIGIPQVVHAETYTTMDSSGNLVTSDSLQSAIATAQATGRPIALDPGHSDGKNGRDPGAIGPNGLYEGDVAWDTAMRTKYYLEKWGIKVVVVRGQNEDPSIKTRVQRAVDANCCAIISMHYNSAGPNAVGSMVLTPRNANYNHDLYVAGQALAKAINGELNKRAGITTRWDSAPTKGYGGGDTYDTGEESDYFGITRYARRNGILGVIIEHEFISNPTMEAKLSDPAFIDRIGYADAWGIWDHFYASDTWWSVSRVDAWTGSDGQITMRPHLVGVGAGMTYSYYYKAAGGSWVTLAENTTKTSYNFMPPSNGTYTLYITTRSSDGTSVSRQIDYKATAVPQSAGWYKTDAGWMYFDDTGTAYKDRWMKDADGWHLFNSEGIAVSGWAKPGDKWFYLDASLPHNAARFGQVIDGDKTYLIDENEGMASHEWVRNSEGTWSWATDSGALASGWESTKWGRVFYFDTQNPLHPAHLGQIIVDGYPYWIDEQLGLATSQWVTLPSGRRVWAGRTGYLWTSPDDDAKLITDADAGQENGSSQNGQGNNEPSHGTWSTETTILGNAVLTKEDLVADLKAGLAARGISYPTEFADKGADSPEAFIDRLWDAALAEGVRPEILYAQAMLETGYLQFNGDVKVGQCNFGGLGATGNGVSGDTYDDVYEGLLAQAQHLRTYTGNHPLTDIVDKRFGNWLLNRQKANPATTIGKLAGTWAMSATYGEQLVAILNKL